MRAIRTISLELDRVALTWTAQVLESRDAGESFHFTGIEQSFGSDEDEAFRSFCKANRSPLRTFPLVSSEIQRSFEQTFTGYREVPCICGYFGRACRQMDKAEGANRNLCTDCPLADFARKEEMRAYAFS